ncbi:MAG TPA: NUDIX hydrolase [Geobacteraceae bacterium]|nr:NUDIX hydrolase [Geobacteraceae bacterium]
MAFDTITCPSCGFRIKDYKNPLPTVDIIIEINDGIVLVERGNEPKGWALPGGFVDYGETLEDAAIREALEETSLSITELRLHGCYSDPTRDPRRHTISIVFVAKGEGIPKAGDDAATIAVFRKDEVPAGLCFDHDRIVKEYLEKTALS